MQDKVEKCKFENNISYRMSPLFINLYSYVCMCIVKNTHSYEQTDQPVLTDLLRIQIKGLLFFVIFEFFAMCIFEGRLFIKEIITNLRSEVYKILQRMKEKLGIATAEQLSLWLPQKTRDRDYQNLGNRITGSRGEG